MEVSTESIDIMIKTLSYGTHWIFFGGVFIGFTISLLSIMIGYKIGKD